MGEKVRIGIQAPQKVPVFRKEIYLEIHAKRTASDGEDRQSASATTSDRGARRRCGKDEAPQREPAAGAPPSEQATASEHQRR